MGDLISRSALLQEVKSLTVTVTGLRAGKGILHEYAKQYRDTFLRIINEQPTIEAAQVVHGKWILVSQWKDEDGVINPIYRCSACGIPNDEEDAFCKHCGADMKGGAK